MSTPFQLFFDWREGPRGDVLYYKARGRQRAAYSTGDGLIVKLSECWQNPEVRYSTVFKGLVTKIHWHERVQVLLHDTPTSVGVTYTMYAASSWCTHFGFRVRFCGSKSKVARSSGRTRSFGELNAYSPGIEN